jgi:prephenate dehydrogenase
VSVRRLAIVGGGLIGTSVGRAAQRRWPDVAVALLDREEDDLAPIAAADVVVLATPVDVILALLPTLRARIAPHAVLIDTGSTKHAIVSAARAAGLTRFVGGHPMAGGTISGPGGARLDLFDGRPWFLVRGMASTDAMEAARQFVEGLGATPVIQDDEGETHDRVMAAVSHLPQVVASALMARVGDTVGPGGLAWSGAGLRDTTRLAASDALIWTAILATNAAEIRPLLLALAEDLSRFANHLDRPARVRELFDRAQARKRQCPP